MALMYVRAHPAQTKRQRILSALTAIVAFAVVCVALVSTARPAHAAPMHTFGDMHNCEALGQGATAAINNYTAEPFDALQIPDSPTFSFTNSSGGSDYLVACQPKVIYHDPNPPTYETNYNNANWDGYGNPFQCVELIDRYDQLRWHDNWVWGNAGTDWSAHPPHFTPDQNGGTIAPEAGDILIWNNTTDGHIAVITAVNAGNHTVTVLEQNFNYDASSYPKVYLWYTAQRTLSYTFGRFGTSQTHFVIGTAYTAYTQNGGYFTGSDAASPVGWLHG